VLMFSRALTGLQSVEQVYKAGQTRPTIFFVGPGGRHLVSKEMTGGKWCRVSGPREQVETSAHGPEIPEIQIPRRRPPVAERVLLGAVQPLGSTTTLPLSYIRYTSTYNNVVGQIRRQGDGDQRHWQAGPRQ
jgi:hypothetical protein